MMRPPESLRAFSLWGATPSLRGGPCPASVACAAPVSMGVGARGATDDH
jgi:hypothetical protein